jgi:lipopolysaccharide biosynthesis glycosyltransferase
VWNARLTWFKKPLAFLHSPYEKGIWIDLDCEVLGSLKSLFTRCDPTTQIALVREHVTDHLPQLDPNVRYSGGVVVFQHGASIIEKWAEDAISRNHLFWSDDMMLSSLINTQQLEVEELSEVYNWRMVRGLNLNAVILHWVGSGGKNYIRTHGGLKPALDAFYRSCNLI